MKLSTERIVRPAEPDSAESVACEAKRFRLTILSVKQLGC